MSLVQTVNGSRDSSELGVTYMHEHVFVLTADVQQNFPEEWGDEDARVADAVAKLTSLAAQGVRTLVDPTVIGLGRYLPRIQRVAAQVPQLHVVVATGCYTYDDVPFFFHHRPDEVMTEMFVRDITEGIGGTGVRAGMLKCAIDRPGLTPGVERVMRSVGRAHHATGTPITVHTHPGRRTGLDVHRVLCVEEGVDPRAIVLGHSGDSTDADHLTQLAELGFVLGMDRFGINVGRSFDERVDVVVELCRRGFSDRMVLSQDAACYIDWLSQEVLASLPQWHYLHLHDDVLPALRARGVTQEQVDEMLVGVPRRFFEQVR
ncbi:MAG: putative phosphotriesterase [Frankiales bacterium]|nr:putative phosphotriesterase [Frankiales bacterium]